MGAVRKVWRGEEPLVRTFWLYGVLGYVLLGVVDIAVAQATMPMADAPSALTFLAFHLVTLAYGGFTIGAVWRSAGNYNGPRAWYVLARLWCVVGVFMIVSQLLTLLGVAPA